uniref:Transmembrane protein 147 n=1 Tax=Panagrolaimus superbus TaxID=310955 RepID=A0A914YVK5_9BILA
MIAVLILDKLVVIDGTPNWMALGREHELEMKYNMTQLTSVAVIKLVLGLGTLGLAAFLEYQHELVGGRDNYIKIALDHIAAMLTVTSAIIDLYAVLGKGHNLLNLKATLFCQRGYLPDFEGIQ